MSGATALYQEQDASSFYYDKHSGKLLQTLILIGMTQEEYKEKLKQSTTLYVGNLSFYTNES